MCNEICEILSGKPSCQHVLLFMILIISAIIFSSTLLTMLNSKVSVEILLFLGVSGLLMILLLIANIAIIYFQCRSKARPPVVPSVVPSVAPTVTPSARAPSIVVNRDGSFNGTNPLKV